MIRRILNNKPSSQALADRENIFHTRYKVLKNTCYLIVDNGSHYNCCSTRLIEKLVLTIMPYPNPYKLQWLNENENNIFNKIVKVKFSIGSYKDNVFCDIVLMEACHILLGKVLAI